MAITEFHEQTFYRLMFDKEMLVSELERAKARERNWLMDSQRDVRGLTEQEYINMCEDLRK